MHSANGGIENHPKELGLPKCREGSANLLTWKELQQAAVQAWDRLAQ